MSQSDRIWFLHFSGLTNADIARRLDITPQRVSQVLTSQVAGERGRPGRKAEEDYKPPPYRRSMALTEEEEQRVVHILASRSKWKWWEANHELKKRGIEPKPQDISRYLRETGFVYNRRTQAWHLPEADTDAALPGAS